MCFLENGGMKKVGYFKKNHLDILKNTNTQYFSPQSMFIYVFEQSSLLLRLCFPQHFGLNMFRDEYNIRIKNHDHLGIVGYSHEYYTRGRDKLL